VKGWLGFREEFTLSNKEKHSVFLDENGRLMLASDPHPYEQFLKNDPVAQLHVTRIAPLVAKVDQLRAAYTLLEEQQQANPSKNRELALARGREPLKQALVELAQETMEIMQLKVPQVDRAMAAGNRNDPVYLPNSTANGFGTGASIEFVHGIAPTKPGSETKNPHPDSPKKAADLFTALAKRRSLAGTGKAYYVQGHLLNAKIYGSGTDWQNLTPLSYAGNALHKTRVENQLNDMTKRPGMAFFYSVVPNYGRSLRQDLLDLNSRTLKDDTIKAIIEAEQHVPLSLTVTVRQVNATDSQNITDPSVPAASSRVGTKNNKNENFQTTTIIDNPIDQGNGSLDVYVTTPGRSTAVTGTMVTTATLNLIQSPMDLLNPEIVKLSRHSASALYKRIKAHTLSNPTFFNTFEEVNDFIRNTVPNLDTKERDADIAAIKEASKANRLYLGR
jgi:hypothetical protein